ncbi:MAG: hypothetical protein JW912_04480 [Sedimentisphaerales bacterium]|nr:hypothetical protein [Sedimentisphaerales bacterium]
MKLGKSFWIFVVGGIVGVFATMALILILQILISYSPKEPSPPKLAGHEVPSEIYNIDFSKRYDLKLSSYESQHAYSNCLIKGFTYKKRDGSRNYSYFEKWLVVELPDKRLVYLQPGNIKIIEESKQQ